MTAPPVLRLATAAAAAASLALAAFAPVAGAGHLVPHLGPGTEHYVTVLVVADEVREIQLSFGLGCNVVDEPDADPAGTLLVFECQPFDASLTTCTSVALEVVHVGEGIDAASDCGDATPPVGASCSLGIGDGLCTDTGAGGANPFRCAIFAQHPIVVYQVECKAYY